MAQPENMLVRIKPNNPRRGYVMKTYSVDHPEHGSARFLEAQGWYEVSPGMAAYLDTINSQPGNLESPPGFDVCTRDEALKLENRERASAREKADAANATRVHSTLRGIQEQQKGVSSPVGVMTTADLGDDEDGGHVIDLNGTRNVPMQTEPKHGTQADVVPRRVASGSNVPGAPLANIRRPRARATEGTEADLDSPDLADDVAKEERRAAARQRDPNGRHSTPPKASSGKKTTESGAEESRASTSGEKHG